MKIAFYCQNVLGLGHITRSRSILRELCKEHEVVFLQGGQDSGLDFSFPNLRLLSLPPIMMKEADGSLYVPNEDAKLETQWTKRLQQIQSLENEFFDLLVIELYPFGRRQFRHEIESLIKVCRTKNRRLKVFCSLRDIMIQKLSEPSRASQIEKALASFDGVFVHSDPTLLPLERTWANAKNIKDKLFYTGFVSEKSSSSPVSTSTSGPSAESTEEKFQKTNEVLVTAGGGNVGQDFYKAIQGACSLFPQFSFTFVFGPYADKNFRKEFERTASEIENVKISDLIPRFEDRLKRCRLSISLAGYNTVMNILNTGAPALLYPYDANWEQKIRLDIFESQGKLLTLKSLDPAIVKAQIQSALNFSPKTTPVDLDGAKNTAALLSKFGKKRRFFFFSF